MFWVLLALILSGCGQSGETSSEVSDSSLVGVWRGTYTNLLEAPSENTYEVDLDLQSDGGFLLRHLETGNSASGAYAHIENEQRFILDVRKSHIKSFRLEGETYEFKSSLKNRGLLLSSDNSSYRLDLRPNLQLGGNFIEGSWYCSNPTLGFWRFVILGNLFRLAYTENGGITYFLSGKISYTDTSGGWAGVSLHIEEALPTMVFSQLSFKISKSPQNVNNGMLYISGDDQNLVEELQPIKCRRAVRDI